MTKKLNEDDIQLFRNSVGKVKPVHNTQAQTESTQRPEPIPLQLQQDQAQVIQDMMSDQYIPAELEHAEGIHFQRPGIQFSVMRKLRRGHYRVEATLDLHGMISTQARKATVEFLTKARQTNAQCVLIIHGKGKRSSNKGPVLKPLLAKWLTQRDEILAYCSARPIDGGSGAIYVLLRKR